MSDLKVSLDEVQEVSEDRGTVITNIGAGLEHIHSTHSSCLTHLLTDRWQSFHYCTQETPLHVTTGNIPTTIQRKVPEHCMYLGPYIISYMYMYVLYISIVIYMHRKTNAVPEPCGVHLKSLSHSLQCPSGYSKNNRPQYWLVYTVIIDILSSLTGHSMSSVFCRGHTWLFLLWLSAYSSHIANSFSADPVSECVVHWLPLPKTCSDILFLICYI